MEPYPVIKYISRESLCAILTSDDYDPKATVVVDVRDSDHIGGHIHSSLHRSSSSLSYKTPDLVQELKDADTVIFHCALSQQRGPGAALKYMLERRRLFPGNGNVTKGRVKTGTKVAETKVLSKIQGQGVGKAREEGDVEVRGVVGDDGAGGGEQEREKKEKKDEVEGEGGSEERQEQVVYVLDGGFVKWQEKYGKDKRVTDKYDEEIWAFGYDG